MFKKIIERIKKINPLVLGFAGFIIIVIIMAIVFWAIDSTKNTTSIDILVAPSTAIIKVGDNVYENGKHDIKPGNYHIEITADEFEPYTEDIMVEPGKNYELYVALEKAEGDVVWYEWYAERPKEDMLLTTISDKNYTKAVKTFEERNPVVKILPYHCTQYENNYTIYIEYRIDFRTSEDGQTLIVIINDITGGNRERALQYIRNKGYNPDDYQVEYNYTPHVSNNL